VVRANDVVRQHHQQWRVDLVVLGGTIVQLAKRRY
jgi:hypothetical protein